MVLPGGETMKFNTALVFLFSSALLFLTNHRGRFTSALYSLLCVLVILIGGLSLLSYADLLGFDIDNLIVRDTISTEFPGRMSPATAVCSILLGLGILGFRSANRRIIQLGLICLKVVLLISLTDLIAYMLLIPSASKTLFFQTMSLQTSLLFLVLSISLIFKSPHSFFNRLIRSNRTGSKLFKKLLPIIVVFPLIAGYMLIAVINSGQITPDFGIVAYTVLAIPASLMYIAFVAGGLNRAEKLRHGLEKDLIQSHGELAQFKEGLDKVAIVVKTDRKGVITYANEKFCEISQYSKSELIGQTHALISSGHHPKAFFSDMWKTIGNGQIWVNEIKNKAKDGSYYWVHTAIVPFKDDNGRIIEYLAIRQDITQRKGAESMKAKHMQELENKNKELQQFAYVASHDLQEPLRTISNFSNLIAKKYHDQLDASGQQSMQFIQDATSRMSQLIKSLLDYSQLEKDINFQPVDPSELINEITQDLGQRISDSNAEINTGPLPEVHADRTLLRLLFQNLISNAIKFSKVGRTPKITLEATSVNGWYQFAISDNGIGIAEEHLQKVFNIFQRLHVRTEYEGTGIGLSQCRKIIELHDGKIWVESKLEEGSTFYFILPKTRSQTEKTKAPT